uniref:Translation initiation factor IF-2, chloroplastic n=1 Tax=Sphondylothamnion multifidum TaxID=193186 RepID=A0A4D6X0R6_9FLOR|nr:Translation initiation factor 2 [Sphondylothamnion multifidum]
MVNSNLTNKFDKKYKSNNLSKDDLIENKKSKLKSNKKNRKIININQNDIYNEEVSNVDIVKNHKFNKNKKKDKGKSSINSVSEITLNGITTQSIFIDSPLTIQQLAYKLSIPEAEIITYLFLQGIAVTINQVVDIPMAKSIATHYGVNFIENHKNSITQFSEKKIINNSVNVVKRPPVITIFGHVDHGKTTLLDSILKTNLVKQESGGITQSINGYEIDWVYESNPMKLVFLDTPGHQAFSRMRLRCAKVADIILLVIAADDSLKSQSVELIKAILEMNLPYIIIINKIDKADANISRVKEDLTQYGILSEEWGGDAIINEVSALTGQNIDLLLSNVCLLAQLQDLSADPKQLAQGTILESYIDNKQGVIANTLVQNGTLEIGDFIVAGSVSGRVKKIVNSQNNKLQRAYPSSIVKILGFSNIPEAGIVFHSYKNDKEIKQYIDSYNQHLNPQLSLLNSRVGLLEVMNNSNVQKLNIILKSDTLGSLEALISCFTQISQKKVQLNLVVSDIGSITRADIDLAFASKAIVIGFNIKVMPNIITLSKNNNVILRTFDVIYDLLDYITNSMLDLVEPEYDQVVIGKALVQTVFNINKGTVAGCLVNSGKLKKMCHINIYRNDNIIYTGVLNSLKRIKDDVDEVLANYECGVLCDAYNLWKGDDIIEAYELKNKPKVL